MARWSTSRLILGSLAHHRCGEEHYSAKMDNKTVWKPTDLHVGSIANSEKQIINSNNDLFWPSRVAWN